MSSHAQRMRLALLRSTKETGEALSRIFKSDEQAKFAPSAPLRETSGGSDDREGNMAAKVCPAHPLASLPIGGAGVTSSYDEKQCEGPPLHDTPFVRASLSTCDMTAGACFQGKDLTAMGIPASRLEESEGWFIADLMEGREEKEVFVASEEDSRRGSMVMVSSVCSLSSMEKEEEEIQTYAEELHEEEKEELILPLLFDRQSGSSHQHSRCFSNCRSMFEAIEQDLSREQADLLSKEREINSICVGNADLYCPARRPCRAYYRADAGKGWNSFTSLQELLDFLRISVKMYGSKTLRSMRFWLPLAESEFFLDQMEAIAPYTFDDFIRASKAAAAPTGTLAFTVVARQCLLQLTEYVLSWGAVEGAATVAAAGETAAVAGTSAIAGVCSTFATVTLVVVAGAGVYGIVRFIRELTNVRNKMVVKPPEEIDVEEAQEAPYGSVKHCLIMWK